jgi:cytochrome c biogenesis protein CcmG/thiol:disulfide interchange protein DsbE
VESLARGRTWAFGLVLLAVAGLVALLSAGLARTRGPGRGGLAVNTTGRAEQVRVRPAPQFALDLFAGGTLRMQDFRGRPVVVNFWASWCPPCRDEAPELEAAWRVLRSRGVVFVGVNVWDSEDAAREFLRTFGISYPNGPDPHGRTLIEFGVTGIPETYVVDRAGNLVRRWIGPLTRPELSGLLEGVLTPAP